MLSVAQLNGQLHRRSSNGYGVRYGIQGGGGSFNEEALLHYFEQEGKDHYDIVYLYTAHKVLAALDRQEIDYGLFAIHNSGGGFVNESIQAIANFTFHYEQQITIPVEHFLMKKRGVPFASINTIMTHPQVLNQCANTLKTLYGHLTLTSGSGDLINTSGAAKALAEDDLPETIAVIGSPRLSQLYDLEIVDEYLQDDDENQTDFWLVSRSSVRQEQAPLVHRPH